MSGEEMYNYWSNNLRTSGAYPPWITIPGWNVIAQAERDSWDALAAVVNG